MEPDDPKPAPKRKPPAIATTPLRVRIPTSRAVLSLVAQANKKPYGRAVTSDDIIAKAVTLLTDAHLEDIKANTLTSEDRITIEFKKYCQAHGNIPKSEFLERILTAGLAQVSARPE